MLKSFKLLTLPLRLKCDAAVRIFMLTLNLWPYLQHSVLSISLSAFMLQQPFDRIRFYFQVQMKTTRAIGQRSAPQTSNIDSELAKKFAARNRPDLDTIKERSASIDSSTQDNELASKLNKQLNKQASLDGNTPPVAKPRGSVSKHSKVPPPVASKPETPNELTAKLSARKAKIGESENAAGIENNDQNASQS